jgi:hypothetical protein
MIENDDRLREWARRRETQFEESKAKDDSLRERVLGQLRSGLWHTTHPDRFQKILEKGAILPEPEIPDCERWCTGGGSEHYPYVRTLGGVSLFEFDQFDPDAYRDRCPSSNWAYFVPYHLAWERAVWLEIDRAQVPPSNFISGVDLLARWKADGADGHNIMPEIEAAYLGPLPCIVLKRAFLVRKDSPKLTELAL